VFLSKLLSQLLNEECQGSLKETYSVEVPLSLVRHNGLGFSGGAPIDWKDIRADCRFQKSPDLAGAERRPLQALFRRSFIRSGSYSSYISEFNGSAIFEMTLKTRASWMAANRSSVDRLLSDPQS